jgi:hypothetical protein
MKKNPWLSGDRVEKWGAGRDYKAVRAKLGWWLCSFPWCDNSLM